MLHTSLLTFLPSPLLTNLPPPIPLQFQCCLHSPAPQGIDTCLLPTTAPACTPTYPNPFISPSLFHYAPEVCSLSTSLWSHVSRPTPHNSHCLPVASSNLAVPPRRGHLLHLPHGSHASDLSGSRSLSYCNSICPMLLPSPPNITLLPLFMGVQYKE